MSRAADGREIESVPGPGGQEQLFTGRTLREGDAASR